MAYSSVPQDIVNVLPSEPLQQLEIAQRIINQAYSNKFSQSEQEAAHLRQTLTQRNGQVRIYVYASCSRLHSNISVCVYSRRRWTTLCCAHIFPGTCSLLMLFCLCACVTATTAF